VNRTTITIE